MYLKLFLLFVCLTAINGQGIKGRKAVATEPINSIASPIKAWNSRKTVAQENQRIEQIVQQKEDYKEPVADTIVQEIAPAPQPLPRPFQNLPVTESQFWAPIVQQKEEEHAQDAPVPVVAPLIESNPKVCSPIVQEKEEDPKTSAEVVQVAAVAPPPRASPLIFRSIPLTFGQQWAPIVQQKEQEIQTIPQPNQRLEQIVQQKEEQVEDIPVPVIASPPKPLPRPFQNVPDTLTQANAPIVQQKEEDPRDNAEQDPVPAVAAPPRALPRQLSRISEPSNEILRVNAPVAREESHPAPEPYSFSWNVDDPQTGAKTGREETQDASGNVVGFYYITDAEGRSRRVDYTAGPEGFKANIRSNEEGLESRSPADVKLEVSPPVKEQPESAINHEPIRLRSAPSNSYLPPIYGFGRKTQR